MNPMFEAAPKSIHRALSRRAALVTIHNASAESYSQPISRMDRVYRSGAKFIEEHVVVGRTSEEIFWDVHNEMCSVRSLRDTSEVTDTRLIM